MFSLMFIFLIGNLPESAQHITLQTVATSPQQIIKNKIKATYHVGRNI